LKKESDVSLRPFLKYVRSQSSFGIRHFRAGLTVDIACGMVFRMSTLAEIEQAAAALPPDQKQELMLFLAVRLRAEGARLPEPRKFSREQIESWITEDEAELRRFQRDG